MKSPGLTITKPALFGWLIALSLVLALLPGGAKRWMTGVLQPIGWIEWIFTGTARNIREIVADATETPLTAEESEHLRDRGAAMERQIAHLSDENEALQRHIDAVTGIVDQLNDAKARVIIASVASGPANPRRSELIVNRGDQAGVKIGDWVAAAGPSRSRTNLTGREMLSRQYLVGKVTDVMPLQSRVRLFTDANFGPERVIPAKKLADGTLQRAEQDVLLYGEGRDMLIKGVARNFYEDGFNLVLVPIGPLGGGGLIAGEIFASQSRQDTAQRTDLRVRPLGDATTLSAVYIISSGR